MRFDKFGRVAREEDESWDDFHARLEVLYECARCPARGENGCGGWQLGGYEWNELDESGYGKPEPKPVMDFCDATKGLREYPNLTAEKDRGTMVFSAVIEAAKKSAPSADAISESYGDIVRSSAAVAVAVIGKAKAAADDGTE